ncbi:MAG: hypothetical protein Q7U16_01060 [Agitococcus sp.]|nr:hypothetical protein [Agitococcus sp.]
MRKNINHANILIVEGEGDRSCLEQLCSKLDISPKILLPVTPKDLLDSAYNSKQGVYAVFKDALEDLRDSHSKRLAIIVDADQAKDGQSFQTTFDTIEQRLQAFDYRFDSQASIEACGLIFSHPDAGFHPIGVWIMPNNQEDGAIESWISACIDPAKCHLFPHAQTVIQALPNRTFEGNKKAKAEVATWLAWQKSPSIGLYAAVGLLDSQSSEYKNLVTWLNYVFPP